jgi:hypothetical protein
VGDLTDVALKDILQAAEQQLDPAPAVEARDDLLVLHQPTLPRKKLQLRTGVRGGRGYRNAAL